MLTLIKKILRFGSNIWLASIVTTLLIVPVHNVNAQSCEAPLFVQSSGQDANVIILFDSSSSMNRVITHPNYDVNTTYSGEFDEDRLYSCRSNGMYTPEDFDDDWDSSPSAYLVTSDHGRNGQYWGNYLNWIFYHATDAERAELAGTLTRIQGAKVAVSSLVTNVNGPRIALWKLQGGSGAEALTSLTTDKQLVLDELNGIVGSGFTPLAEALEDIYFELYDNDSMIQAWCQKTFIIMLTDGYPTFDLDIDPMFFDYDGDGNDPGDCASINAPPTEIFCSEHVDDVAAYLFQNDLMPGMDGPTPEDDKQNVITYTIGFNIDAQILQETADNGGGRYYTADDPQQLYQVLEDALVDIIVEKASGTSAAIVSTEGAENNQLFRAKFTPGTWRGELEAFDAPYVEGSTPNWDAASLLKSRLPASRSIFTSTNGTNKVEFTTDNTSDLRSLLGASSDGVADDMINWVRGAYIDGYRDREDSKLGDIVDSSPVPVGGPSTFHDYLQYPEFRAANKDRDAMIYVGANDGMIHAFKQSTGEEAWAYIPNNLLDRLQNQMDPLYCHEFYVNATPSVVDAYVDGQWRTLLIAGQKEGGNGYTCLDVTDPSPANVRVMWDKTFPVSESWVTPIVVRDKTLDKHVAVIGTGWDESGTAELLVIDLKDGSILDTEPLSNALGANLVTRSTAMDYDFDGYDDLLYVADLDGHVWRFDITSFPWEKTLLFQTHQPIQAAPVVTIDEKGNSLVYVGTGKYIEDSDPSDTETQSMYCIIDNHSGNSVSRYDMVDQTGSFSDMGDADGWFIDFVNAYGERHVSGIALAAGTVYFTTFQPNSGVCASGGTSWLYELDYDDGSNSDNDDGTEDDNTDDRLTDLGEGIYSQPAIDLGNEDIIIQNTKTSIRTRDMRGQFQRVVVRSWRQIFQ